MSDTEKDKDVTCFSVDGVVAEMVIEVEENQKTGSDDSKDISSSPLKDYKKNDDSNGANVIKEDGNEIQMLDADKEDQENSFEINEAGQKNDEHINKKSDDINDDAVEDKKCDEIDDSVEEDKKSDKIDDSVVKELKFGETNKNTEEFNEISHSSMGKENSNEINQRSMKNGQLLKGKRKPELTMDGNESDIKDVDMPRYPGVKKRKIEEDSKENEETKDISDVSTILAKSVENEKNGSNVEEPDIKKESGNANLSRSLRNRKADVESKKSASKQNTLRKLPLRKNEDAPDVPDLKPKVFWLNGVGEGQGVKLGDIPEIKERIAKAKSIRALYRVLFFQWPTNGQDLIGQILEFNGFPFDKSSYEFSKRQSMMKIMLDKTIFHMCELLDIRKGDKNSSIQNILDFLLRPYAKIDPAQDPAWQPVVVLEKMELDDKFFDLSPNYVTPRRGKGFNSSKNRDVKSKTPLVTPTRSTRSSGTRKVEIVLTSESEKTVKKSQEDSKSKQTNKTANKEKSSTPVRSAVKSVDKSTVKESTSSVKVNATPGTKKPTSGSGIKASEKDEKNKATPSAKDTKEKTAPTKKDTKPFSKEEKTKTEEVKNSVPNKLKKRQKFKKKKKINTTSIKKIPEKKEEASAQLKGDSERHEIEMTVDSEPDMEEHIEKKDDDAKQTSVETMETVQQKISEETEKTHTTLISTVNLSDSSETESSEETKLVTASKKPVKIPMKRKGKALRHFPKISESIQTANFSALQRLHILLFGASDKAENLKSNILSFGGFPFLEGSDEWKQKHFLLSLLAQNNLREYLNLLCIPYSNDDQPGMINKLMRFLAVPSEESLEHRIQSIETEVVSSVLVDKSSPASINKSKVETKKKTKKKEEKKVSKRPRKVLMSEEEARRLEANFAREQRALARQKKLSTYRPIAPVSTATLNMHSYIPQPKSSVKPPTTDPEQLNALLQTVYKRRALKAAGAVVSTPNKGEKTKLGNIENIKFLIVTSNLSDLEILHRLIFMLEASKSRIRKNILDFDGFGFNEDSPKYKHRMDYLKSLGYEASKRISFLLGLCPLNTNLPQTDLNELIMYFLMSPCKTKQTVPITQMPTDEPQIIVKSTALSENALYTQKPSPATTVSHSSKKMTMKHSTPQPKTNSQKARKTFASNSKISPVKKILLPPSKSPALGVASLGNTPQKLTLLNSIPAVPAYSIPKSTGNNPLTNLTLLNTGGLILNAPKSPVNSLLKVPVVSPNSKMQLLNQSSNVAVIDSGAGKIPVNLSNIPGQILPNQIIIPQASNKNSMQPIQAQLPLLPGTKMVSKAPTAVASPQEFIVQQKTPDGVQRTFKLIRLPPNHPLVPNKPPVQQTVSSPQLQQQVLLNPPFTGNIPPGLVIMKNNTGLTQGQNLQILQNAPVKLLSLGTPVSPVVSSPLSKITLPQVEEIVIPDEKESIPESANTSLDDSVEALNSSEDNPPTDEDLFSSIQEIILSSNFEDITLRNVIERVAGLYPNHDLTQRHTYMKECVKKIIIGT